MELGSSLVRSMASTSIPKTLSGEKHVSDLRSLGGVFTRSNNGDLKRFCLSTDGEGCGGLTDSSHIRYCQGLKVQSSRLTRFENLCCICRLNGFRPKKIARLFF